jgi:hypothetical protein
MPNSGARRLSESWPKFKSFYFHLMPKNEGKNKVPRLTKIHVQWQLWCGFIFSTRKQRVVSSVLKR